VRRFAAQLYGTPRSTFRLDEILDGGTVLVRLPKLMCIDTIRLTGSLLLAALPHTAAKRADLPEHRGRLSKEMFDAHPLADRPSRSQNNPPGTGRRCTLCAGRGLSHHASTLQTVLNEVAEQAPTGLDRPKTPQWLATFAKKLYNGRCIRCGVTRPLEVAHLIPWPPVKNIVLDPAAPIDLHLSFAEQAHWLFHQPVNVVLLCCNCHTLLDDPTATDVTIASIVALRDTVLTSSRAASLLRAYLCRGVRGDIGSTNQPNVVQRWLYLIDWLKRAYDAGNLTEPHRFMITPVEVIDVPQNRFEGGVTHERLPLWNGKGFTYPDKEKAA
jgi:hypothetical protein